MTEKIEIVTLSPNQWQDYRAIRLEALQSDPEAFASKYSDNLAKDDEYWKSRLQSASEEKTSWMVFARSEAKIVGMVGAYVKNDPQTAEIVSVFVQKEFRGLGISKMLMKNLIERIKQNSQIKKLVLDVNADQEPAVRLYSGLGFSIIGTSRNVLGDGNEHELKHMEMLIRTFE